MKKFIKYLIFFLLLFFFVDFFTKAYINSAYHDIEEYKIETNSPKIEIIEATTTNVNGEIRGRIINNTGSKIDCIYVRAQYYSKLDNYLGDSFVRLDDIKVEEQREFVIQHRYFEVGRFIIGITYEEPEVYQNWEIINNIPKWAWVVSGLIVLYYMPLGYLFGIFPF